MSKKSSYKTDNIKPTNADILEAYVHNVTTGRMFDPVCNISGINLRTYLNEAHLDSDPKVIEMDKLVLETLLKSKYLYIWDAEENLGKPIQSWWWYMDKLSAYTYPEDELPDYLKEIYLKHKRSKQ